MYEQFATPITARTLSTHHTINLHSTPCSCLQYPSTMYCRRWWWCDGEQVPGKYSEDINFRPESKPQNSQQRADRIIKQVQSQSPRLSKDCEPDLFAELSLAQQQLGMEIRVDKLLYVLKVGALKETGAVVLWNEANPGNRMMGVCACVWCVGFTCGIHVRRF